MAKPKPLHQKQRDFLKALRANYSIITKTCEQTKVARATYYVWLTNPKFRAEVDKVEEDLLNVVEDLLKNETLHKEPWAIRFFLGRRHAKYRAKAELDIGQKPDFLYDADDFEME
jgi:hypothetical protein